MDKEARQLLKDPQQIPTDELIYKELGKISTVYKTFIEELTKYDLSLMDWRYYMMAKPGFQKVNTSGQQAAALRK